MRGPIVVSVFVRIIATIAALIGGVGVLLAQTGPISPARDRQAASRPVTRDEALWNAIQALLQEEPPEAAPYPARLADALAQRRQLLEQLRIYLSVYPGGPRRDQAVQLELRTLSEVATLSGGAYGPLCQRVREYIGRPPSEAALYEAAYWAIHCRRLTRGAAGSQPTSASVLEADAAVLAEYRAYIEQYSRSRHVPRMATVLFDAAAARGDEEAMRWVVNQVSRDFPGHAVTALLAARQRRHAAVGRPFALRFEDADGKRIDTAVWEGSVVLIVVWAGFSGKARACVREIEALRRERRDVRVCGVNLDESEERMQAASGALGLSWPQLHDGLGWANRFAREWAVREVPTVFVVDREGCLVGVGGERDWRELVAAVADN